MTDWEVSTGELAALASRLRNEATALVELALRVDQVSVGPADFAGRADVAGQYTDAVRTGLAGTLRQLADRADAVATGLSGTAHSYDGAEHATAGILGRLGGAP